MRHADIRDYYEKRYAEQSTAAFPSDPSRYRAWFGSLLHRESPGTPMLDYGCGVGHVCTLFADLGYRVTGIDISPTALGIARQREPRGEFLLASSDGEIPVDDVTFRLITCLGVLEHLPRPESTLAELRRVAHPDVTAIWVVPNSRSPFFWFGRGTGQVEENPRSLRGWQELFATSGWQVSDVRRDPGPIDRPIAPWKRFIQAGLNRLPLTMTYQFVIETRLA